MATKLNRSDLITVDGATYVRVTPNRAQAAVEALDIARASGTLDKRRKGVITSLRATLAAVASGAILEAAPACWVYIRTDGTLSKIGHARDLDQRQSRSTDLPTPLTFVAAWLFESVEVAMRREGEAHRRYPRFRGEWFEVDPADAVTDLSALWGAPQRTA